jgi:hypothetical protein
MAGHGFIHVCVGVDDLEESKGILVDVDAAELSDFVGSISDETDEVAAEVSVNLRSIDVGKVVRTWSHGPEGGNCAGANTSEDTSEVETKVILMGHPGLSCHVPVVRSIFILLIPKYGLEIFVRFTLLRMYYHIINFLVVTL